ncbi:unnamed protein product [Somion occarium]|uniref:F-box domain-containing protein n=1 Tax=Somion occarium TaxID=3059160 RepID=A0ABP1DWD0_9APHY
MSKEPRCIPPELVSQIVSELQDDTASFQSCAMVSREWLALCRPHIFRSIILRNYMDFVEFQELAENSPIVQEYVQSLQVNIPFSTTTNHELDFTWVNEMLSPMLSELFKNLQELFITSTTEIWKDESFVHLSRCHTVKKLSILKSGMSLTELCALISAFPELEECIVEDIIVYYDPRRRLTSESCFPGPMETHGQILNFIPWLLTTGTRDTLQVLELRMTNGHISAVGDLLRAVGPTLQELEIICDGLGAIADPAFDDIIKIHLNLSCLVRLRKLSVHYGTFFLYDTLLSTIRSPSIRSIQIRTRMKDRNLATIGQHQEIDQLLSNKFLKKHLTEVIFAYEAPLDHALTTSFFEEGYPELAKRGILKVVHTPLF